MVGYGPISGGRGIFFCQNFFAALSKNGTLRMGITDPLDLQSLG